MEKEKSYENLIKYIHRHEKGKQEVNIAQIKTVVRYVCEFGHIHPDEMLLVMHKIGKSNLKKRLGNDYKKLLKMEK